MSWLRASRSRRLVVVFLLMIAILIIIDFVGLLAPIIPRYFLLVFAVVLFIFMVTVADRFDWL